MRISTVAMLCGLWLTVTPMGAVAQTVDVPAGERLLLKAEGRGVQVYRCDGSAWVFVAPDARLFVKGVEVGSHGAGPVWHDKDGSSVWGEVVTKAASPHAGAIPVLLLKAVRTDGQGVLAGVNYIQRLDTEGGSAPASGCDAGHVGAESRVAYSAQYLFYGAAK